jgi:hypothetical protein
MPKIKRIFVKWLIIQVNEIQEEPIKTKANRAALVSATRLEILNPREKDSEVAIREKMGIKKPLNLKKATRNHLTLQEKSLSSQVKKNIQTLVISKNLIVKAMAMTQTLRRLVRAIIKAREMVASTKRNLIAVRINHTGVKEK